MLLSEIIPQAWLAEAISPDGVPPMAATAMFVALFGAVATLFYARSLLKRLRTNATELAALNANLEHAQRIAHIGYFTFNPKSGESRWTEETFRIYRVPRDAGPPRPREFIRLVHPEDRALLEERTLEATRTGGRQTVRFRVQFGDEIRWIRASFELQTASGQTPPLLAGAMQDVTEQEEAAEQIRALNHELENRVEERTRELEKVLMRLSVAEQRWSFALDGSGEGVWDWCPPTNEVFFSRRWKEMLGYGMEEIPPSFEAWSGLVHPEDLPDVLAAVNRYVGGMAPAYEVIYRMRHKDGRYVWIQDRGKIMEWAQDGRALRLVGTHADITARIEAERQLREQSERLDATNRELEAFSYSVSHDLRTPLRSIDGFSQALLEDCHDQLDEDGRDYLRRVRAATQRMGRLIDDLLSLSRVSRGEVRRAPVDLSGQAHAILAELRAQDPKRAVEVVIAGGLTVHADPVLLEVVMMNLLGNAWKYTARQAAARIEVGTTTGPAGEPAIFVKDDGAGFEMAYAAKLFSVFQRLHSNDEFEGNGVGLATVQRILHRHGGRVWAEAEIGRGATFLFSIPAAPSQSNQPAKHG